MGDYGPGDKLPVGTSLGKCCGNHAMGKISIAIPLVFLPILFMGYEKKSKEILCIYLVAVMACYWITESIPLYLTSVFPVVFLPLLDILPSEIACSAFFSDTLAMFLGGLIIALAIEYSNLHQRIALSTIKIVGCSPRKLHFGLTTVTCFISLWISNSAATAMMCPIIKAILEEMNSQKIFSVYFTQEEEPMEEGDPPHPGTVSLAFYFTAAYASTIGGCGTLIGTGTNLTFKSIYEGNFPTSAEKVEFPQFMIYSCPLVVVANMILMYIGLQLSHMGLFRPNSKTGQEVAKAAANASVIEKVIAERYVELGPMSCHEIQVALLFTTMVLLLFFRSPNFITGWGDVLKEAKVKSSAPVLLIVILCFALPVHYQCCKYCIGGPPFPDKPIDGVLAWPFIHKNTPWGLCFLLGGGSALAKGSEKSGMAKMLGEAFGFVDVLPPAVTRAVCIIIGLFCTAFSSNVAICNILVPIFAQTAMKIEMHPLLLTLPPSLAISCAFHLPVSTPPNAIICGYAAIKTKYLAIGGILPTCFAFLTIFVNCETWGQMFYPATKSFPEWAIKQKASS